MSGIKASGIKRQGHLQDGDECDMRDTGEKANEIINENAW
jgi:hypothetical protein